MYCVYCNGCILDEMVELILIGKGLVVCVEVMDGDKFVVFDLVVDKMVE